MQFHMITHDIKLNLATLPNPEFLRRILGIVTWPLLVTLVVSMIISIQALLD